MKLIDARRKRLALISCGSKRAVIAPITAAIILGTSQLSAQEGIDRLIGAARSLTFTVPGNSAFIMEKKETIPSVVAVIFG